VHDAIDDENARSAFGIAIFIAAGGEAAGVAATLRNLDKLGVPIRDSYTTRVRIPAQELTLLDFDLQTLGWPALSFAVDIR
jgi:hypothetical protein